MYPYYKPAGAPVEVKGLWKLEFMGGGPVIPGVRTVEQLGSWTEMGGDDLRNFSGVGKYSLSFERPGAGATVYAGGISRVGEASPAAWLLDLGKVGRTAEVVLNGKRVGMLIGPDFRVVVLASALRERNTLEVIVSNGMINRIEDLDRRGVYWKKFYNYNFPPHERANRGADGLFDASKWAPVESGLIGPVTLTPLEADVPRTGGASGSTR